jgi:hypothetical protein
MSRVPSIFIAGSLILVGCSESQSGNTMANAAGAAAPGAAAPAPPADFRRLAECAAKMEAVGRLYSAVASQSSGAEAEQMRARASERSRAGFNLRMRAEDSERAAASAGAPAGSQVPRIITETEAALEAERARQPFGDFAIWLGREADQCAPLVAPS